jgi:hypothetical protein
VPRSAGELAVLGKRPTEIQKRSRRKSGSRRTLCWRETASNSRSLSLAWIHKAAMTFRARYFLIGCALVAVDGLIGWHFFDWRGEVLKPDGVPVGTVMGLGWGGACHSIRSGLSGWRHRKFWTRSPISMAFAIKDGVPSTRFETHNSASMLSHQRIGDVWRLMLTVERK